MNLLVDVVIFDFKCTFGAVIIPSRVWNFSNEQGKYNIVSISKKVPTDLLTKIQC